MKRKLLALIGGLLVPMALQAGELRTFTSSDGSQKMLATLVDFDGLAITLDIDGGKRITAPIDSFSKEDADFAQQFLDRAAASRHIAVEITKAEDTPSEKIAGLRTIISRSEGYDMEFRNNGTDAMEDLIAEYQIFWLKDQESGASRPQVTAGQLEISNLAPQAEVVMPTEMVPLVTNKSTPGARTTS